MGDIYKDVYSASKNCINTQFCADGGSFDSSSLEMPRSLKIRIVANPDFWGFGSLSDNTLIEGWGTFNEGFFDFFDGYDPDHSSLKTCGETTTGPYTNEQRPDVSYRSVYDPENGDTHYAGGSEDGVIRGGAEAYLLDRAAEQTGDGSSCDNTDPVSVFKTNPAGYGSYPKILFNSKIYKNITGAWRIEECDICYDDVSTNALRVYDCSGAPKQHINADGNFATLYDPFQERCTLPEFAGESGCQPDGTVASQYSGSGTTIIRETGLSPFLAFTLNYNNGPASGLFNGQSLGLDGSLDQDGVITIFDVAHQSSTTTFKSVGSVGATNYSDSGGFAWTAFNTYDPNTCCGGAAYGVDYDSKRLTNSTSYHIDIGRVFNNPKNVYYSNRIDRSYQGFSVDRAVEDGTFRRDYSYVAVNEDGNALLVASGAVHEIDLACSTGVWDATATHIYELDGTYSTSSGVGSTALSTESGFYPLFPKELPYFGSFMDVDRWDNAVRSLDDGTREVNRNTTCYTKTGSLAVYPDCLSQWTSYTSCDPQQKFTLNNVPRLSLVYRGCDYNDPCTFDDSGRPWTAGASGHPSNMEDLIRGFGGQEIQMYINLGTARAAEIKREPCCCKEPPCPGTNPPEFIQVESPVTFPCFPKFDLRPSDYGCQDPIWFTSIMNELGLPINPSGLCDIPFYDACTPVQPYTTYGYIRNLCGKETNSRREVIDSLSTKLHTGDYDDLNFSDNTVEPMYVAFEQDTPDCCSPSGFPTGSTECDPGLMTPVFAGSGATAELVIDATGGFTFNVLSSGSGYQFGGGVYTLGSTVSPEQRFDLTFGAANDGLSSITSIPGFGSPFNTTIPLTIVAGGSGIAGSGGFSYNACNTEGTVHYWGLTDYQGRLALPYFRTKPGTATLCGRFAGNYVDYSSTGTLINDWPKDQVPFLVEIDHEDNCTSCSVTQMPPNELVLTVESLPTKFLHNIASTVNGQGGIYGWNHCKYEDTSGGKALTPTYNASTDTWTEHYCESGDGLALKYGVAYTGETCNCADGSSYTMRARTLEGTNTPIGYVTYDSGSINPNNSYRPFGNCAGSRPETFGNSEDISVIMEQHTVYMKASLSCGGDLYSNHWTASDPVLGSFYGEGGLESYYGCGGTCATSFPAPNSSPNLSLDFFYVRDIYSDIFERMDDALIFNNPDFLKNGLVLNSVTYGVLAGSPITFRSGPIICGSESGSVTSIVGDPENCQAISSSPTSLSEAIALSHCVNGNKNKIAVNINLNACLGSRVLIYGCSSCEKGQYTVHTNGDGCFGGACSFPVRTGGTYTFGNGCQVAVVGSGIVCSTIPYTTAWHDAFTASNIGDFGPEATLLYGCFDLDESRCCLDYDENSQFANKPDDKELYNIPGGWLLKDVTEHKGCWCNDFANHDVMYDVTWSQLTNPVTSGVTTGWYGTPFFPTGPPGNCDNISRATYWSGENIPGLGNIGPLPMGQGIALHYDDSEAVLGQSTAITVEDACSYATGPNRETQIGAQLTEPFRSSSLLTGAPNLQPEICTKPSESSYEYYATCGTPAPFSTYSGGIGETITVNKKACWPEVMTVHKIDCLASGYKLHVSREYFEHNQTWYYLGAGPAGATTVTRLGLIQGGENSSRYLCEETYLDCLDPGNGVSATVLDYSFALKMMTPTDTVLPVHPDLCATGADIVFLTDASAVGGTTSSTYSTGCLLYPSISGQQFYNYYNAFYDAADPSAIFLSDAGGGSYKIPPDPEADCNESYPHNLVTIAGNLDPLFTSVGELRTSHSCLQDLPECGGDIWCNKEFFPRRPYLENTRITRFGALSICTQNSQLESASWYEGHGTTWDDSPNKQELSTGTFLDACDNDAVVLLDADMGIDDNVLFIPTNNSTDSVNSILTLMGTIHPGFKSNVNEKTCIYASSGECLSFLPEHSDSSIRDITFTSDEYGYYLNKLVASGSDDCLFTPFKIMVDVECCADRISHRGTTDPTNLTYISQIPAGLCQGWISNPICDCNGMRTSSCDYYDTGPLFNGLFCLKVLSLIEVFDGGMCPTVCPGGSAAQIYYAEEFSTSTWLDVINADTNDPLSELTSLGTFFVEEPGLGNSPCDNNCNDGSPNGYSWAYGGTEREVFSFDGRLWILNDTSIHGSLYVNPQTVDAFSYNGSNYMFSAGGGLYPFPGDNSTNCCVNNSFENISPGDGTGSPLLNGGCVHCDWSICGDAENGTQLPKGVWFGTFPPAGVSDIDLVNMLDDQGCVDAASLAECPYPSVAKFTITEAI